MTKTWCALAATATAVCLIVCRQAGGGGRPAATPAKDAGAGGVPDKTDGPALDSAPTEAGSMPAHRLNPAACGQLRKQVEKELATVQRCKSPEECVVSSFEYVFRPCGMSITKGASLTRAAADARRYQDRCHPVIHPVKCAYLPRPACERGRCILAPPAAN